MSQDLSSGLKTKRSLHQLHYNQSLSVNLWYSKLAGLKISYAEEESAYLFHLFKQKTVQWQCWGPAWYEPTARGSRVQIPPGDISWPALHLSIPYNYISSCTVKMHVGTFLCLLLYLGCASSAGGVKDVEGVVSRERHTVMGLSFGHFLIPVQTQVRGHGHPLLRKESTHCQNMHLHALHNMAILRLYHRNNGWISVSSLNLPVLSPHSVWFTVCQFGLWRFRIRVRLGPVPCFKDTGIQTVANA